MVPQVVVAPAADVTFGDDDKSMAVVAGGGHKEDHVEGPARNKNKNVKLLYESTHNFLYNQLYYQISMK